jgi:hypothetical protein
MAPRQWLSDALERPDAFLPHCAEPPKQALVETRLHVSIRRNRMSEQGREEQVITFPESDGEGTDGQGSPGIIEEKNREAEAAEREGSAFDLEGDDTDGQGSTGILEEQVRAAREREAGSTAREGSDGYDTDGAGSGGILDEKERGQ